MCVIYGPEHESQLAVCWPRDKHMGWQRHGRVVPVLVLVLVLVLVETPAPAVVIVPFPELTHCRSGLRATLVQHRRRR
jgi:hypothetical protein